MSGEVQHTAIHAPARHAEADPAQAHQAQVIDLEALAGVARTLQPDQSGRRGSLLRDEAGFLLDGLLVRVARGHGALDLAIGSGLAALTVGDRLLRLGFSRLGDYSRERLGLPGSTAEKLARLARLLGDRPLLQAAVRSGAVSLRKAETIAPLARGADEAGWVERARVETVRALAAEVRAALGDVGEEEEQWERVVFSGSSGEEAQLAKAPAADGAEGGAAMAVAVARTPRQSFDEALTVAGTLLGATSPRWQRVEAICQEYLGDHPVEDAEAGSGGAPGSAAGGPFGSASEQLFDHARSGGQLDRLKGWLEQEYQRWAFLTQFDPAPQEVPVPGSEGVCAGGGGGGGGVDSPAPSVPAVDLVRLDADLRRLRDLRARWDELLGHLAMLLRMHGLWRDMQFLSFGHYCEERLGMSGRAVEQRVALEQRFYWLPDLRDAMRCGRVSYEKARIIANCATEATLAAWLDRAARLTCIALSREAAAQTDAQLCAAGAYDLRLPVRVAILLHEALRAARQSAGRWIRAEEALGIVCDHYLRTWKEAAKQRNTIQRRVLDRDQGCCQVPGCSRAAQQVHHVRFRSQLGATEAQNLVSLCAAHHLHGIHAGYLRVTGRAPDQLRWRFRPGGGPWFGRQEGQQEGSQGRQEGRHP